MEFVSPFEKKIEIVFACDFFIQDVIGGAELSTDALIKSSPYKTYQIRSNQLTKDLILKNKEKYWVFGNFANLDFKLIPSISENLKYQVLEYDYKLCKYRSIEKHEFFEKTTCNCHNTQLAKMIENFFGLAEKVWWMSKNQLEFQASKLPNLKQFNNEVLSSVFDEKTLETISELRNKNSNRIGTLVFDSDNWLKGTNESINWCKANNVEFNLIKNATYIDMLKTMRSHETLVYLPNAKDTCPRMVIEAKLLGCELVLNDNVQHRDESWFNESHDGMMTYLKNRTQIFWDSLKNQIGE
jgi:hypothetical protein